MMTAEEAEGGKRERRTKGVAREVEGRERRQGHRPVSGLPVTYPRSCKVQYVKCCRKAPVENDDGSALLGDMIVKGFSLWDFF